MKLKTKMALIEVGTALTTISGAILLTAGIETSSQIASAGQHLIDAANAEQVDNEGKVKP